MFESRLFFTDKLIEMGAQITLCDPHRALVIGNDFPETPARHPHDQPRHPRRVFRC
jgi:hypothetical protein